MENQESSTDDESEEDDIVFSGKEEEDSAISSDESTTTPQTHSAPFIYIGNSKQYADNPQIAHRPQTHSSSEKEPKQRRQAQYFESQQTRAGHDHASFSGRHEHGLTERQEAPSHRSFVQDPGFQNTGQRPAQGRHQRVEPFQPTLSRHLEPPSQYKQSSEPLHQSGSYITKPFGQFKPTSEPPFAHSSIRRDSSTSYGRNQQADFTYGRWKTVNPFEATTSSGRPPSPPLFDQPQVPLTNFTNAAPSPSANTSHTQVRPPQRKRWPPSSQDQALNRATWSHSTPVSQPGPPTGHFSINVPPQASLPVSPKQTVAVSTDRRSPTAELDGDNGRRQTRVSAAQIQQQVQLSLPPSLAFSLCWHGT